MGRPNLAWVTLTRTFRKVKPTTLLLALFVADVLAALVAELLQLHLLFALRVADVTDGKPASTPIRA